MIKYSVTERNECRVCSSSNVVKFLSFSNVPFFDEVLKCSEEGKEFLFPMDVYFCSDCRSVQSLHDVNIESYYRSYQYVASDSLFVREYMESLARYSSQLFDLRSNDKVIDIGAADGYFLSCFNQLGLKVLGFEAAENLVEIANKSGITVLNSLFTEETIKDIPHEFKNAQLITLLHTFDHLTDPVKFLDAIKQILDPDRGVLLLEVHDLKDIIEKNETALFGHEHATYLHLGSLSRLLMSQGFRIVDYNFIDKNLMRGSSMLIAASLSGSKVSVSKELDPGSLEYLDQLETFLGYNKFVTKAYQKLREFIKNERKNSRKVAGYGGWGRGITFLAMAGLDNSLLEFIADKNTKLHGNITPGSHVEIVSPNRIQIEAVDTVIVFNYAYIHEIRDTHSKFIADGGKILSVIEIMNG